MRTLRQILDESTRQLEASGVERPRDDAEALIAGALGAGSDEPGRDVGPADEGRIRALVARRAEREPLGYITGRTAFRELQLAVDSRVHVPRDDRTGLLVDVALELRSGARVHEVGTGCGAVALAIKHERLDLEVTGTDISPAAVEVARANAARLGLDVPFAVAANLPEDRFDLVVANLPYSALSELEGALPPESSRYQPRMALIAGSGALDAIRGFVAAAPAGLRVALEHAPEQTPEVEALLTDPQTRRDRAGEARVTVGVVR